jgi:single-stranded-DNA-specific exonuclease
MHAIEPADLLGVERSVTGRRWLARVSDERAALTLAQRLGIPEIVARVLAGRGVGADEAERFLNPTLRGYLPDPSALNDMMLAAERTAAAVVDGETIAVFGDYDVDGATSAALLERFVRAVGGRAMVYIPERLTEGYGPSERALLELGRGGARLILTVDCGTTAHRAIAGAKAAGLDVIVVDHHVGEARLPPALAVVNPNRIDEAGEYGNLAGVGVTFLFVIAVNRALREAGWYGSGQREPDLMQWLDLVALGTVCDVVALTGLNRALVAQGLKVMARRGNTGLAALADVAGLKERPDTYHAGFLLGPRINAGGRLGDSALGARLLATDDAIEAADIARRLDTQNRERRQIEAAVLEEATEMAKAQGDARVLFVVGEGWHAGVIGNVAGRLRERFGRPACVVALDGEEGKASGRSIPGVDLGSAVIAARQAGIIEHGGGHPMAAGFTVARGRAEALHAFLAGRLEDVIETSTAEASLLIDGVISPAAATVELISLLEQVGPFGAGNAEPRFALDRVRIAKADVVGGDHVRCFLAGEGGARLKGIAFRAVGTELGRALAGTAGVALHLAGRLRLNSWAGVTSAQLHIEDAAPAHSGG